MYIGGYNYSEEKGVLEASQVDIIRTVDLLVEHAYVVQGQTIVVGRRSHRFSGKLLSEVLASGLKGLLSKISGSDEPSLSKAEISEMTRRRQTEEEFQGERAQLTLVVNNRQLAEAAYPNPEIRAKLLSMIDGLHANLGGTESTTSTE